MGKKTEPEVVASHEALSVVSKWLGVSPEDALDAPAEDETVDVKRPAFLGLGAKFLAHHKAIGIAAELDVKLKRRLEAGRKRTAAQATEEAEAAQGTGTSAGRQRQQQPGQNGRSGGGEDSNGSEDEEERGKARQVRQRHVPHKQAWQATAQPNRHQGLQGSANNQAASSKTHVASMHHQGESDEIAANGVHGQASINGHSDLQGLSKAQKKKLRKRMKKDALAGSPT